MSEEEKPKPAKKERLRGFPKIIGGVVDSVKDKPECKELLKGLRTRILFNNQEDKKWACLITVDNNQIKVEGIKKEGKNWNKRNKLHYWGYWEFPTLAEMLTAGGWKAGKWIRKMGSGKVKGASQIALLGPILALAAPPAPPEKKEE